MEPGHIQTQHALNIPAAPRYDGDMTLIAFDHVNIVTSNLASMTAWYEEMLGLSTGPRPPFDVPGSWLYLGETAVVHLVGVDRAPEGYDGVRMEHVAFRASGYEAFIAKLNAADVDYVLSPDLAPTWCR